MAISSVHIVVIEPTRTIEYIGTNLYRVKECGTYMICQGVWPKETSRVSYDTLCKLIKVGLFKMI